MKKQASRNGKIDLLRFVFAICVVLNHAKHIMPNKDLVLRFSGYSFAVEFFFLVSGYLLMASIEKASKSSTAPLSRETGSFLLKKYKAMYPEAILAYIIALVVTSVADNRPIVDLFEGSWFEMFLLLSTGLSATNINPAIWYVSSMLLCMALLYPLVRKHKEWAQKIILPAIALLICGYMLQNYGTLRDPRKWVGFTIRGNFRALAELSLGMLCYGVTQRIKAVDFTAFARVLLGLLELACYGAYIYYMARGSGGAKDMLCLLIICVAIIISFSGKSIGHTIFNNKAFAFLGKLSLPLYLVHYPFSRKILILLPVLQELGWKRRLAIYMAVSLLTGLLVMLISYLIRKWGPKILSRTKHLVIKQNKADN